MAGAQTASISPSISVVVLAWPPGQARSRNVFTLLPSLPKELMGSRTEVIVLCNGRDEELSRRLRETNADVVIESSVNLGVASGWNRAAESAKGDVIVFANEDAVLGPRALADLVEPFAEPSVGLTGSEGELWSPNLMRPLSQITFLGNRHRAAAVLVPPGLLLAVRRSAWQRFGGVNESLSPAFYEEVDLAMRVREAGLRVVCLSNLDIDHRHGVSARSRRQKIEWLDTSASIGAIHRRNHRKMLRRWSRSSWRSTWLGHLLVYWTGIAGWRLRYLSAGLAERLLRRGTKSSIKKSVPDKTANGRSVLKAPTPGPL